MPPTSAQITVNRTLSTIQGLLQPKLENSLTKGYHGVVGVSIHIQDGTVTHVKITGEQVAKPNG